MLSNKKQGFFYLVFCVGAFVPYFFNWQNIRHDVVFAFSILLILFALTTFPNPKLFFLGNIKSRFVILLSIIGFIVSYEAAALVTWDACRQPLYECKAGKYTLAFLFIMPSLLSLIEEMWVRGIILGTAPSMRNAWLISIIFAIGHGFYGLVEHGNWLAFSSIISILFFSQALNEIFLWSRSIILVGAIHAGWNQCTRMIFVFNTESGEKLLTSERFNVFEGHTWTLITSIVFFVLIKLILPNLRNFRTASNV